MQLQTRHNIEWSTRDASPLYQIKHRSHTHTRRDPNELRHYEPIKHGNKDVAAADDGARAISPLGRTRRAQRIESNRIATANRKSKSDSRKSKLSHFNMSIYVKRVKYIYIQCPAMTHCGLVLFNEVIDI